MQDGCSIVEILHNFSEYREASSSVFSLVNPDSAAKENYSSGGTVKGSSSVVTDRVVQEAALVAFVMSITDTKIQITCDVEVSYEAIEYYKNIKIY